MSDPISIIGGVICHIQRDDLKLIEQVQYKAAIVFGCWEGPSRERLYEEIG